MLLLSASMSLLCVDISLSIVEQTFAELILDEANMFVSLDIEKQATSSIYTKVTELKY